MRKRAGSAASKGGAGPAARAPARDAAAADVPVAEAGAASPAPAPAADTPARGLAVEIARLLHDDKCTSVAVLDVRGLSQVTDFLVIATGTSDRQMHSAMSHAQELAHRLGARPFRRSADDRATWLLADFVDVVVHLFEPNARAHYDLELLWGDAERVAWERPDQATRDRAGVGVPSA